ncbi:substrate-binding domain-containing protein [Salmonella enterica subsp. enterica]|nr:substrate-binding domain-containing protein [Salmonella enterica subsp. enterica]
MVTRAYAGVAASESWLAPARRICRAASRQWLSCWDNHADGGIAYNDNMAAGALTALKITASPFRTSSVIGFDDIPIARYTVLS